MNESRAVAATPAQFAATDMLHRRVPLSCHFHFVMGERAVRIKTDSGLIGKAIRRVKLPTDATWERRVAEWEIAVEVCGECFPQSLEDAEEQFETCRFGPSRSVRMVDGSWFAHTPPSLNGVGFAMVTGNECHQVQQLAIYLRAVLSFVDGNQFRSDFLAECEVSA